jgi:cyclic beta-1,2-glucan synthetase
MRDKTRVSFNIGFLRESAINLAENHSVTGRAKKIYPIRQILDESRNTLLDAYRILSKLAKSDKELTPAGEWLIDNFYIIQEQIVQIGLDFPKEYQKSLPKLENGEHKGLPLVYELMLNFLTHTDNVIDSDVLMQYVQSYQEVETLKQGEIWAIPIMIRLILIEKLAEKASRIMYRKKLKIEIESLIQEINKEESQEPGSMINKLSSWIKSSDGLSDNPLIFIELYNQLQTSGLLYEEQKRWFNYHFRKFDMPLEEAMHIEAQKQSRLQVSIQNAVVSLRNTSETDWSEFVEECSVIEKILRLDPSGYYPEMDFQTRDSYRRVIERISRRSGLTETEVAEQVLLMVEEQPSSADRGESDSIHDRSFVKDHVGYFLAGDGYEALTEKTNYVMPLRERVNRLLEQHSMIYLSAIILNAVVLMVVIWLATDTISKSPFLTVAVLLVSLFPALDLAVAGVNRFFAFFLTPRILPKLDYKEGIPDHSRTMVVVPTMFSSPQDVQKQIEKLEIRSLANHEPSLQFALLSDFRDSDEKETESDRLILEQAEKSIQELNQKYKSQFGDKFYLLHRERLWNELEGKWMGWERKRGKLEEFNSLLCDLTSKTSYCVISGDFQQSINRADVKYVITLDSDTKLPPESAKNLIRTISHPLNRAIYDPEKKRITSGYSIIQPRISITPESARKTWFSKIFSGNVGIDPYSTAVSDIYQDLSGEAVFTGKGIYDVQAFHDVMDNRFPENRILSHDLIESTYLRAGLATDIELFDDFPSTYVSFSKRNHRWIRGDWQIVAWLFSKVPGRDWKEPNRINLLSKWKIFDNLRRSLSPFFLTIFFIAGWFLLPGSAWIWTAAAFGILAFPIYISLSGDMLNRPERVKWKLYMEKVRANLKINSIQALLMLIILPHQAVVQLDAVIRTLFRLLISKKNLLEWVTASQIESSAPNSLFSYIRSMFFSVVLGTGVLIAAILYAQHYLWIVIPFFLIWFFSPLFLWYVSQPVKSRKVSYSRQDYQILRNYARRTWFYFERFVNEEHFWLPPDNYQEDPPLPVAERTSPTNMGLALVSTQVAYNMGFITYGELLDRVEKTLLSMYKLEKYKGHFYNWYETKLGEVLSPKYISTVDSGNLAASLITIKEAIKQSADQRGINKQIWKGLHDSALVVREIFEVYKNDKHLPELAYQKINNSLSAIIEKLKNSDTGKINRDLQLLKSLKEDATKISSADIISLGSHLDDMQMQDLLYWQDSLLNQIEKSISELRCLSQSNDYEFESYSLNELIELFKDETDRSVCLQLLNRWKTRVDHIVQLCDNLIDEMDFTFLYLKKRKLFSIGYNVEKSQTDKGTYDLLASEARIASYVAIAKGDIPVEHWFSMSRRLTSISRNEILLSWGGTMFEYLMPLLFMKSYEDTLLNHTSQNVITWQMEYGKKNSLPWGSSESAYNFLNIDMHYQYRTFGAPGLGLKRGLAEEYVVAPYASMLALMIDPESSLNNLKAIDKMGGVGLHGFYDSIDFTPSRLKNEKKHKVVKTYMVHHHGMSLIAIENLLHNWSVQNYFHSDLRMMGSELILQEKIPRGVPIKEPHPIDVELEPGEQETSKVFVESAGIIDLDITPPRLHLLSNGNYTVFVTHAGTGSSKYKDISLVGWQPDTVIDPLGLFFYIKDTKSGEFWSSTHQPVKRMPDRYDTWYHDGKIVTSRVDDWIETTTEISVSPDYPIEFRKLTLTNYSKEKRTLELTSYGEIVLNRQKDHRAHPAFSKLFIQTDYLAEHHAIIAKRRPRSEDDKPIWLVHTFAGGDYENLTEPLQFETERSKFIGRGRTLSNPSAMDSHATLGGSVGNVSDPIISLRKKVTLGPGEKAEFIFGLGFANSREEVVQLADMFDNKFAAERAFDLAEIYSSVELNHFGITSKQAHYFQKLASHLLYSNPFFRTDEKKLKNNRKQQQGLWVYGISGDMPLIVFRIDDADQLKGVKTLLKAHEFWRVKGVETELLIINDHAPGYIDEVQEAIQQSIEMSIDRERINKRGGVFIHRSDKMPDEDLTLILSVAHIIFEGRLPNLSEDLWDESDTKSWYENINTEVNVSSRVTDKVTDDDLKRHTENLHFFNGYGGFANDGTEYHIIIKPDTVNGIPNLPPAPWINVIANPSFGFTVSETGAGYTWSENSRENKLTSWSNDPVTDSHSEAFYIRDEEKKIFWSPTPGPVPGNGMYKVIHGFGYTEFRHESESIEQSLIQYVPESDSLKISKITLQNRGENKRSLSLFRYTNRVLGVERTTSSRFIVQERVGGSTIYAHNQYNNEFAGRTVFNAVVNLPEGAVVNSTTSRKSFIGRNRSLDKPRALVSELKLDSVSESPGEDPCAAFRISFELEPDETVSIVFLEGESENRSEAEKLIEFYSDIEKTDKAFINLRKFWESKLTKIQVKTPEKSLDVMVNGWLMYQNLSSRIWARTAFYQSGGAFGFRDQLQDVMAVLYVDPALARKQILLHAAKQFEEGDVLHWWHPPTGRGIRSKITDDRLWLPYVTGFYLNATGDNTILDEPVTYISARNLEEHEHEVYLTPEIMSREDSLYIHCCKAIDISLKYGSHGLPLMGAGDWNDGMNRVGQDGRGESVWLGFFIHTILKKFEKICRQRGEDNRADQYRESAENLEMKLNSEGWDGEWYLRAFYDDGTPLGSSKNSECRIDAISQAWSVISGVAAGERAVKVLDAAESHLISKQEGIIRLLTPPFDKTEKNPGYIKGYIPGVRENGGQYTHGALWLIKAFAELGHGNKAVNYLNMINPVNHSSDNEKLMTYKVEPYVVAADVYGEPPLTGMGGWTWYTGSGGWMYRVALESVLGFSLNNGSILLNPSISSDWPGFSIRYVADDLNTVYEINVKNPSGLETGVLKGRVDNQLLEFENREARIPLKLDGKRHIVNLELVPGDRPGLKRD